MSFEPVDSAGAAQVALGRLLRLGVAIVLVGGLSVAFTISFAALVYTGPLSPLLGHGIGLALASGAVLSLVGLMTHSFRGVVCSPQDVTAILLAPAAATIAASRMEGEVDALLPTIAMLCTVAMLAAGALALALGWLRVGTLARYIPYPVIGGFLAATGYLLVLGAIGIALGEVVDLASLSRAFEGDAPVRWAPWLLGGVFMALILRRSTSDLPLPLCLVGAAAAFYGSLPVLGLTLDEMQASGYLLGPFGDGGFLDGLGARYAGPVEWSQIAAQAPTVIAVAGMTLVGALLKSTGLEHAIGCEVDFNKDLRGAGLSNILAAPTGGLPGHIVFSDTLLAHRLRLPGAVPGIVAALAAGATLAFGAAPLSFVPAGLVAMIVAYLGFDLLLTWLIDEGRRFSVHEYAVVVAIVVVAATVGFLEALSVGLVAAVAIFVVSYARTDFVRVRSTAASRRSRVERAEEDDVHLARIGHGVVVLELGGYLFFGTAHRLLDRVRAELAQTPRPTRVVIDFARVSGIDASAVLSLAKVVRSCKAADATCVFSGLPRELRRHLERAAPGEMPDFSPPTLDAALEDIEDELLEHRAAELCRNHGALLTLCQELEASDRTSAALRRVEIPAGEVLLQQGAESLEVFVLMAGSMNAEIAAGEDGRRRVASFQPGALIGEIAYYASTPRTAWVVARTRAELLQIDLDRLEACDGAAANRFHRQAARSLALRVRRMTRLLSEAEL